MAAALAAAVFGLAGARTARAQARPSEESIFGGSAPTPAPPEASPTAPDGGAPAAPDGGQPSSLPPSPPPPTESPGAPPAAAATPEGRDQALLGATGGEVQHLSDYQAPDNPLQIGGQVYLRAQSSALQGQKPEHWSLSAPSLLDVYLDARPNPRVRAFVLGRMSYDPTVPPDSAVSMANAGNQGAFTGGSVTGFTTFNPSRGPNSLLDQLWIRFDIAERVFVTFGKQHVRWGTGRFWQPTDYLHLQKRNPLDVFDARGGTSMLKLHVPWESRGWNFYAFAVADEGASTSTTPVASSGLVPSGTTLQQVAGGARAEIVVFDAELGLDILAKHGQKPRIGVDLSTGIGDFDVYADVGIRWGEDFQVVQPVAGPTMCTDPDGNVVTIADPATQYHVTTLSGIKTQAVGGINYSRKYNDNDMWTVGGEYFYNQPGYSDPSVYPGLLINDAGTPLLNFFYTGRHYGALYLSLPAPYSWNYTTFTLSTLGNLTDKSFVSRLDYSVTLLTHLTLEAFVGVHYGSRGGEFRLGFDLPAQYALDSSRSTTPPACFYFPGLQRDPLLLDLGLALRLKI